MKRSKAKKPPRRRPLIKVADVRDANRYRYLRERGHLANFGRTAGEIDRAVDRARRPYR